MRWWFWRLGSGAVVLAAVMRTAVVSAVFVLVGGGMMGVSMRAIIGSGMAFSVVGGMVRLGVRSAWRRRTVVAHAHVGGA